MLDDQVDFCGSDTKVDVPAKVKCNGLLSGKTERSSENGALAKSSASKFDFVTDCGREFNFSEVDVESQELIEKISGEKCLKCNGYTLFDSFPTFLKDFLNLEIRDDDVWVCSFPRSGKFSLPSPRQSGELKFVPVLVASLVLFAESY